MANYQLETPAAEEREYYHIPRTRGEIAPGASPVERPEFPPVPAPPAMVRRTTIKIFYQDINTRETLYTEYHAAIPEMGTQVTIKEIVYQINRVRRDPAENRVFVLLGRITG